MRRGDLYWVDFNPSQGSETNKIRPAVIVSNDGANRAVQRTGRGVVTVVPVTTNTQRVLPFQVLLPAAADGLKTDSKAQAEQLRSVAPTRLRGRIGALPAQQLKDLENALRLHLKL